MREWKKELLKYNEILVSLLAQGEEHFDKIHCDVISQINHHIKYLELKIAFGFEFHNSHCNGWVTIGDNQHIGLWGKDHNRSISWLDDGEQPENEWLYQISFSTGAYVFSQEYPTGTFKDFFQELKSYKPKYIDSSNKCLYFTSDNAAAIHADFKDIFKRHAGKIKHELALKRKVEIEKELAKIEAETELP